MTMFLMLALGFVPNTAKAQEKHSASAHLQIQVTVIPALVALQQAQLSATQPSHSSIDFHLQADSKKSNVYLESTLMVADEHAKGQSTAVLRTTTVLAE